jgi:hypothetical protein
MSDDRPNPNHKVNVDLRRAAGKGRFTAMPEQSPPARAMNTFIRRAAGRGSISDRQAPVTEPAAGPAAEPAAAPADAARGVSTAMNSWIRRGRGEPAPARTTSEKSTS